MVGRIKVAVAGFVVRCWPQANGDAVAIHFVVTVLVLLGLAQASFAFGLNPVLALAAMISLLGFVIGVIAILGYGMGQSFLSLSESDFASSGDVRSACLEDRPDASATPSEAGDESHPPT